jgi:NADPH-dependent ferric siderophore reductase
VAGGSDRGTLLVMSDAPIPVRREPPRFRRARVVAVEDVTPHLRRVRLAGDELRGMDPGLPGASVRLLTPEAADAPVVVPEWTGNEFRAADGTRVPIRTLTPVAPDPAAGLLTLDVVRHGTGVLTAWVDAVGPGGEVAVSGTGRGYTVDPEADAHLLAGDESALPALRQVLAAVPDGLPVQLLAEVRAAEAEVPFPDRPGLEVRWIVADPEAPPGDGLVHAVAAADLSPGAHVWAAGEAAAVQRIRRHLFDDRDVPRSRAHVRGYWKVGRGES